MGNLMQDLRYAFRTLIKKPGFTVVAVIALALGIGANTAIFSIVNTVLLRPLPFDNPDKLVWVWDDQPNVGLSVTSLPDYLDWRDQSQSFEQMATFLSQNFTLTSGETPEKITGGLATANLFPMLRVKPALGRLFADDENFRGKNRVVVLTDGAWKRRFGSDPNIIGKSIVLNGNSFTIIGVLPVDFQFEAKDEFWAPLPLDTNRATDRGPHYLPVLARLKPGVSLQQAQFDMDVVAARIQKEYPDKNVGHNAKLQPLYDYVVGDIRPALLVLMGAVGFVLLIACANVANLLLARATVRQREIAVRRALGASRGRLIQQLLTESLLLAVFGGALGMLLADLGIKLLIALKPASIPRLKSIGIDGWVLGFTLAISLATGIIFGIVPALQSSKSDLNESLKEGGRSGTAAGRNRLRSVLAVFEIAMALVLLIGSGLMIKSFLRLQQVNPGFNAQNVLTFQISLPQARYKDNDQVISFYQQLLSRLHSLPGVQNVGAVTDLPFSGSSTSDYFRVEGQSAPPHGEGPGSGYRVVSPDYFKTMGVPLIRGREFNDRDAKGSPGVVLINETMAHRYWPSKDPIGDRIFFQGQTGDYLSIVGIVGDIRHVGLDTTPDAEAYVPYTNNLLLDVPISSMTIVLRTTSDTAATTSAVRSEVASLDRSLPVYNINTMDSLISESMSPWRFNATILGIFAVVALVLAIVGIYGVMAYSVTQRTHEIGIRMALGAQQRDVLKLVVGQGFILSMIGVAVGLVFAFGLTRVITSLLYGVSATDPWTFAAISSLLILIALLASYIPARRASKVDPMIALRYE